MKLNLISTQFIGIKICIILNVLFGASFVNAQNQSYFKDSYQESRQAFLIKITKMRLKKEIFKYSHGEIDYFHLPAAKSKKNLLIVISGTHGVEGFVGSAVQRWMIDQYFKQPRDLTGLVMVHGLNAFGFSQERRVNENNIDLNRNFILTAEDVPKMDPEKQKTVLRSRAEMNNQAYEKLNIFLNPQLPAETHWFSKSQFFLQSLFYVMKFSLQALRESIVKGQYQFPKGIFYGGEQKQIQTELFDKILNEYVDQYKNIFIIDLHTGYGAKGKLHLLTGSSQDPSNQIVKDIFSPDEIDFADKKDFYNVQGDVLSYLVAKTKYMMSKNAGSLCFEYGTMDSQKTTGSIESLRRMVLENQNYFNPQANESTQKEVKTLFREMFYPSSPEWREGVLQQSREPLEKILHYLER